jgi:hypothetical protein
MAVDSYDPSSIPAPELHGCQVRPSMRFETAAAVFDDWLSSPIAPNQARYRSKNTIKDCRTKTKALNRLGTFASTRAGGFRTPAIYGLIRPAPIRSMTNWRCS